MTVTLSNAKRIVVKVGSSLLVDPTTGAVHHRWLKTLCQDIARFHNRGQQVLIVSSGAIALGRQCLNFTNKTLRLEEKQAAAAAGMIRLAHAYQDILALSDITVAQILLTMEDSENRRRYINARNTLETLLKNNAVPLINENDTTSTDEIRFGDNDRIAARVAAMISADAIVLLSDIDGLYTSDPRLDKSAQHIPVVHEYISNDIETMAGNSGTNFGSGGMITKIKAASIAMQAGSAMVIADGRIDHPLSHIENGGRCTWFHPKTTPTSARKKWIAGSLKPVGALVIDDGALNALLDGGKSLLPAGVKKIEGHFERGDAVIVRSLTGDHIARGLVAYSAVDAAKIIGNKSHEIESVLGYRGRDEMIHRDDLVFTQ